MGVTIENILKSHVSIDTKTVRNGSDTVRSKGTFGVDICYLLKYSRPATSNKIAYTHLA